MGVKFPQQSVIYLAFCLFGVLLFIFLGIIPSQGTLSALETKIVAAKLRLEEQKTLASLYQTLKQGSLKKKAAARKLPLPKGEALPGGQMDLLSTRVRTLARQARMEMVALSPALSSLGSGSKSLALEVSAKGEFPSFRQFLTGLEGVPYVEHVEEIQMQQNPDGLLLKVKFWVTRG